uniref:Uncharacterized protein n=1 Tax=Tanacetum cinerariifolium TaxID=118510 RepID=A0A699GPA9_TANCI|nr:hypothetical protein [Tanacetum cinerariifolium]
MNTTNSSVVVFDSSALDHNSADKSSVYNIPFSTLEKLGNAEPVSGPKTIKSILKSNSIFKPETLKGNQSADPQSCIKTILLSFGINTFWNAIGAYYLSHPRKKFLQKGLLNRWRLLMGQIIQCPVGKTGGYDQITNKDAIILFCLANGVNVDYANIFWEDLIINLNKNTREKVVPYTRFVSPPLALKASAHKCPSFIAHMLAICNADEHVPLKVPKPYSQTKIKGSKDKKPGALVGSSGILTRSKSKESKAGASKKPAGSQKAYLKKRKESSQAMDSNPSQPLASTLVVADLHKKVQQVASGPTSLGVTGKERVNPQLSSAMSAFNKSMSIYSASFVIHFESASGNDASADSTSKADPGTSTPNDSLPPQQDKAKSISDGLETVLTKPKSRTSASVKASEEIKFREIKLEDMARLVLNSQKHTLELKKVEATDLKARPSSFNMEQLNELTVKPLKAELRKLLSTHNFNSSFPTELKELPSEFLELYGEVKELKKLVNELEELPKDFLSVPKNVEIVQSKLKILDALPSLLGKVNDALNRFAQVLENASQRAKETSVPSAGQADTVPAEGEENINQATIS